MAALAGRRFGRAGPLAIGFVSRVTEATGTFTPVFLALGGLVAVAFLVAYLRRHSLAVFGWYRIALATLILFFFYRL